MNSARYMEVPCPLCGCERWTKYVLAPSHYGPESHQVTRCDDCGMIFTNPQLISYQKQVENTGVLTRHLEAERLRTAGLQAHLQMRLIARFVRSGRLLDFGCGAGVLVNTAIEMGWDAVGLDMNRGLVSAANQHWGFDALESGSLEEFFAGDHRYFDAIVSNQVFEHLQDPVKVGTMLVDRLKPGGVFLIDVPYVNQPQELMSRGKTLDPTSHWCHFSRKTIKSLVRAIGAEVVYTSAAPAMIGTLGRFLPQDVAARVGSWSKRFLPPVGTGVCVIGQKCR